MKIGIDKGAKYTGYCAIGNGEILIQGVINHRNDVKERMDGRRMCRERRRRRLWYRAKRFLNRASSRRSGRIPPSVKANVEEVYRVVRKIPLPISEIWIEDVQIDIAKLNNPDLRGKDYQNPTRLHEILRMACLMRDDFQCVYCKVRGVKLEAHHIQFRRNGGKDTINNLATLCNNCHDKLHDGKISLNLKGENGFRDRMAQHTMQGKTHLYELLGTIAPVNKVFGYETAEYRKSLNLPKEHYIDALCIVSLKDRHKVSVNKRNLYTIDFRASQNRQLYKMLPKKGKGRVKYQVNKELDGFRKGDLVRVRGFELFINSIHSNKNLAFRRSAGSPSTSVPRKCKLIEKAKTIMFNNVGDKV